MRRDLLTMLNLHTLTLANRNSMLMEKSTERIHGVRPSCSRST